MNKMRCKARAVADSHTLGFASTGTPQVGLRVEVIDGELAGQTFVWYGYFTTASEQRTLESLGYAGWDGTDFVNLPGLGSTEFELQLEEEVDEETQGPFWRATFINKIGVAMKSVMDDDQKRSFAARLEALAKSSGIGKPAAARPKAPATPARGAAPRGAQPRQREPGDDNAPMPSDDDIL